MNRWPVPFLIVPVLLTAGCLDLFGGAVDPGPAVSNEEAARLLREGLRTPEERHTFALRFEKEGREILRADGATDPAAGTETLILRGDPQAFPAETPEDREGLAVLKDGIAFHRTRTAHVVVSNGTAHAALSEGKDAASAFLREFRPNLLFANLTNGTVLSAAPALHGDAPAAELQVRFADGGAGTTARAVFQRDPARLLAADMVYAGEAGRADDPLRGARLTMEFRYGAVATLEVPVAATRGLALAHHASDGPEGRVLTFLGTPTVPTGEVEARVLAESAGAFEASRVKQATVLWSMRLSEGTKAHGGTNLTFEDRDKDGKVSRGDVMTVRVGPGQAAPAVVIFDAGTGTYVIPAAGVLLAALAAVAAALRMRRR